MLGLVVRGDRYHRASSDHEKAPVRRDVVLARATDTSEVIGIEECSRLTDPLGLVVRDLAQERLTRVS